MDTTIRNLDERAYRRLKAHAALTGQTVGEAVSEAMRVYLDMKRQIEKTGRLRDVPALDFGEGSETLSEDVDAILYGS